MADGSKRELLFHTGCPLSALVKGARPSFAEECTSLVVCLVEYVQQMDSQELEQEQVLQRPALLGEHTGHRPSGDREGGILQAREVTAFLIPLGVSAFSCFPPRELLMAHSFLPVITTMDVFITQAN